ncbi:MAG: hypothetical protein Q4P17_07650 [Methanobacterium sp.]|nr:hypothetical protein [Methanobacterium sp.]
MTNNYKMDEIRAEVKIKGRLKNGKSVSYVFPFKAPYTIFKKRIEKILDNIFYMGISISTFDGETHSTDDLISYKGEIVIGDTVVGTIYETFRETEIKN